MPQPGNTQAEKPTAIDPHKFIFGISANAGGAIGYALGKSGAGVTIELGKGNFNSEINLMIPTGGFGLLLTFNSFIPSRIGGFYVGGGIGLSFYRRFFTEYSVAAGLNIGYKFVMKSGLYFRTGGFVGFDFGSILGWNNEFPVFIKPDLAVGWTMK
jgi:hypothetical protein